MGKAKIPIWWQVFISEYMQNGQNAKRAYLKAKPKVKPTTAEVESTRLLSNPKFAAFLKERIVKVMEQVEMSREEWARLLADIARVDIRKFLRTEREGPNGSMIDLAGDVELAPDWKTRPDGHALDSVSLTTTTLQSGAVVQRVNISSASKLKALEIIGKAAGYLTEKVDVKHAIEIIELVNPYSKPDEPPEEKSQS